MIKYRNSNIEVLMLDKMYSSFYDLFINNTSKIQLYSCSKYGEVTKSMADSCLIAMFLEEIIETEINNHNKIKWSPNQVFQLSDGSYKKATDLRVGDLLMSYYELSDEINNKTIHPVVCVTSIEKLILEDELEDIYTLAGLDEDNFCVKVDKYTGIFIKPINKTIGVNIE